MKREISQEFDLDFTKQKNKILASDKLEMKASA